MGKRPKIAITMGEATGIGPELALQIWRRPEVQSAGTPILFGDAGIYTRVSETLKLELPTIIDAEQLRSGIVPEAGAIVDCARLSDEVTPGTFNAITGRASFETVCHAIDATLENVIDAVVTGPIQKEAWSQAGVTYPGHTELLADRVGRFLGDGKPVDVRMMLASDTIACVLETIHVPLADVPGLLNVQSLTHTIELAGQTMRRRNFRRGNLLPPRIGVCGLNPHAGENGMFSHGEEQRVVQPAIEAARRSGWDVYGPLPPDTAFTPSMRSKIDVYVCLYHDQGLIPLKALAFDDAVNVTLGLPIVRTSVDHGTAMDLAWRGTASHGSMVAAFRLASELVESKS